MPFFRKPALPPKTLVQDDFTDHAKVREYERTARIAAERAEKLFKKHRAEQDERERDLPRVYDRDGNVVAILRSTSPVSTVGWVGRPPPDDPLKLLSERIAELEKQLATMKGTQ